MGKIEQKSKGPKIAVVLKVELPFDIEEQLNISRLLINCIGGQYEFVRESQGGHEWRLPITESQACQMIGEVLAHRLGKGVIAEVGIVVK